MINNLQHLHLLYSQVELNMMIPHFHFIFYWSKGKINEQLMNISFSLA